MTDEVMAERRRLFLQEMARIRERELQALEAARVAEAEARNAPTEAAPEPVRARRPRMLLPVVIVCGLALMLPISGLVRRELRRQDASRMRQAVLWSDAAGLAGPLADEERRMARLQRARSFFGMPDIIAVWRGPSGLSLLLQPGLSDAKIIARARRARAALSVRSYPTRDPQPWRVGVCSADIPCPVAVVRVPGPGGSGVWRVTDGRRLID